MQLHGNKVVANRYLTQAAGFVTLVFGVLTALMAAASVVIAAIAQGRNQRLPLWEAGLMLLGATTFVLLGWGVLRHNRLCAGGAGLLAGAIAGFQIFWIVTVSLEGSSMFLLVVPAAVTVGNVLAWSELRHGMPPAA